MPLRPSLCDRAGCAGYAPELDWRSVEPFGKVETRFEELLMRHRGVRLVVLFSLLVACLPARQATAQDLRSDLGKFVETPAVAGYEQPLAAEIRARLGKFKLETDNLGDLMVTVGSGSPHRVIVTPMDEAGYVVSGITPDGFLRVQRLPQAAPNPVFDLLHTSQPVLIHTRKGKWISGVSSALSTHLQTARQNPPRANNLDDVYVDIGAASAAEVRLAGVDVLDPLVIERQLYDIGYGRLTAPAIGDRFGCAALVELLRHLDASKIKGTLTVAFVTQQVVGGRGLERLSEEIRADEMVYVGRLLAGRPAGAGGRGAGPAALRSPAHVPGDGAIVAVSGAEAPWPPVAALLKEIASANQIKFTADFSAPLPRGRRSTAATEPAAGAADALPPSTIPARFAHVGIPTRYPATPAEIVDFSDLDNLVRLLEVYAQGSFVPPAVPDSAGSAVAAAASSRPKVAPTVPEILKSLVEKYGVSGHEEAVREEVKRLLPPWAKPETDAIGNLILHLGATPPSAKTPHIAFVAHTDEIGYTVRAINADGSLSVQSVGGGITEFFSGHVVLIHTAGGERPGVIALPSGWEQPGFEWPRGPQAQAQAAAGWRVETGARSADEVAKLGIHVGDWITVPKKYRRLYGTRANARSFDDRVGCTALVAAVWALGPSLPGRDVTFIWSTQEEVGLRGALAAVREMAAQQRAPEYVFAVDTFVSSDSPLESKRFADALVGKGFVARSVDNSSITPRSLVDRLVQMARAAAIPMQYGVTGGGNDGSVFLRYGSIDVGLGWPLRYSHSPGEVIDTRDAEALGRIVALLARSW
jgi:putative aminopeptidase FrvX